MKRLLVVKLSDIGDVLTVTPALQALRQSLPELRISILVPPRSAVVLTGSPLVDEVLAFDKFRFDALSDVADLRQLAYGAGLFAGLRAARFDALALMHHLTTYWGAAKYAALALAVRAPLTVGLDNGRGFFLDRAELDLGFGDCHEVEYWLRVAALLGAEPHPYPMSVALSATDRAAAETLLSEGGPFVAIHPGGGGYSTQRRWPLERFVAVARSLRREAGLTPVVVGGPDEAILGAAFEAACDAPIVNLVGQTTLLQAAAVIERCRLFIGNDSGLSHLAAAVGTPVVAVFGPTNDAAWAPWSPSGRSAVVRAEFPCRPCLYVGRAVGHDRVCQAMTCLEAVSPSQVLAAAAKLLA